MVARVPAQSQKLVPQLPSDRPQPRTRVIPPGFHESHLHLITSQYFCRPFVFIFLQIPSPATPLFSNQYKTPGVTPLRPLCSDLSALCVPLFPATRHFPFIFFSLPPLFLSLPSFAGAFPLFSIACSLFCQNTRAWAWVNAAPHYPPPATHYSLSLLIPHPAWWKQVQGCRCE